MGGVGDPWWVAAKVIAVGSFWMTVSYLKRKKMRQAGLTAAFGITTVALIWHYTQ